MAASQAKVRAGQAFISLFTDDSRLVQGLNAAAKKVKDFGAKLSNTLKSTGDGINFLSGLLRGWGTTLVGLGGTIVVTLKKAATSFQSVGDEFDKMSIRTGLTTEFLSEMSHAAGMSGSSIEDVENAVRSMSSIMAGASMSKSLSTSQIVFEWIFSFVMICRMLERPTLNSLLGYPFRRVDFLCEFSVGP
jgi:hypothetical protein